MKTPRSGFARWILPEIRSDGICFMSRSRRIPRNGFAFEAVVTLPQTGRWGCWGSMERKVALRTQCFCKFLRNGGCSFVS